ncbi:hypothetical protein SIID45300_01106 [Candidatus Magnetaquicoccaceae bacterium FCR-1]|uniref:Uncharacterized protein n=1 Tax=Candidatus Magnetaquiglobus chichijimensis TaxID=3141448 RepID=A0ABQ0C7C8_9PROT
MSTIVLVGGLLVAVFAWVLWVNNRDLQDVYSDIKQTEEEEKAEENTSKETGKAG